MLHEFETADPAMLIKKNLETPTDGCISLTLEFGNGNKVSGVNLGLLITEKRSVQSEDKYGRQK